MVNEGFLNQLDNTEQIIIGANTQPYQTPESLPQLQESLTIARIAATANSFIAKRRYT